MRSRDGEKKKLNQMEEEEDIFLITLPSYCILFWKERKKACYLKKCAVCLNV